MGFLPPGVRQLGGGNTRQVAEGVAAIARDRPFTGPVVGLRPS